MRRLLSAAALAVFSASAALAADVYTAPPQRQAVYSPQLVYNWTGFYIGVNAGMATGRINEDPLPVGMDRVDPKGWFGGFQAGYNWQFAGNWLLGLETDLQWANIKGSRTTDMCPLCGIVVTQADTAKLNWFGTVRGRFGYVLMQDILLYGTAGFAYGGVQVDSTFVMPGWTSTTTMKGSGTGLAFGAGLEWAFAPQWTVKAEWLRMELGLQKTTVRPPAPLQEMTSSSSVREDLIRIGFNYRFRPPQ